MAKGRWGLFRISSGLSACGWAQGVSVQGNYKRGSHTFKFPVMLAPWDISDWKIMLGASLLPPLGALTLKYYIVRPLRRRYKLRKVPPPSLRALRNLPWL